MKGEDFKPLLRELTDFYGAKVFSEQGAMIIWRIMEPLTPGEGRQVVESVLEQHGRAPTPAQIRQAAAPYLKKLEERRQQARSRQVELEGNCHFCAGSGFVLALSRKDPTAEYSFACPYCEAASVRKIRTVAIWDDARKPDFVPVSFKLESHAGAREFQEKHRIPVVRAAWAKRLEKHPWALANLRKARGVIPDYLNDMLREERGGMEQGGETLERKADPGTGQGDQSGACSADPTADGEAQDLESAPTQGTGEQGMGAFDDDELPF